MPTRNSWSPWKVLLVAVFGCTIGFAVLVGGGIYWLVSVRNEHRQGQGEREFTEADFAPAPAPVVETEVIDVTRSELLEHTTNAPFRNELRPVPNKPPLLTEDPLLAVTNLNRVVASEPPAKEDTGKRYPGDDI